VVRSYWNNVPYLKEKLNRERRQSCKHSCGLGARLGGMVNRRELLINIVIGNKLKMLISLNQKVSDRMPFFHIAARKQGITGEKAKPNPSFCYINRTW
jgi:hypothetical protein